MRPGPNNKRSRGRHGGSHNPNGGGGQPQQHQPHQSQNGQSRGRSALQMRHQTFDSNGPDVRVRGTAIQVYEKYQSLARDAATNGGDRVVSENYLQHAEHYYRIVEAINAAIISEQAQMQAQQPAGFGGDQPSMHTPPQGQQQGSYQGHQRQGGQQPQHGQQGAGQQGGGYATNSQPGFAPQPVAGQQPETTEATVSSTRPVPSSTAMAAAESGVMTTLVTPDNLAEIRSTEDNLRAAV